jgi:adenylate cyclase
MSKEIELKLSLPARALPALRRHPLLASSPKLGNAATLDNTYYDTPELALKARGVAVRTRRQGRQWLQTVKCAAPSSGGLSARPEWETPYHDAFDFGAVDDADTAKLLARHRDALVPVFTTRFRRETRRYQPHEGLSVLLMVDHGTVSAGERSLPICELELELEQGEPLDLLELAATLAHDLPLMPSDESKAARGYRLFLDQPVLPTKAEASALRAGEDVVDALRSLAFACLRQWQANAAAAGEGHTGPEFIHQLRVALRRLRSLLKLFAPALPAEFVAEWNVLLRDNANAFGEARDLDVMYTELLAPVVAEELADDAVLIPKLLDVAARRRDDARRDAEARLDPAAQGRLILAFHATLMRLPGNSLTAAADLRTFARLRLQRQRKRGRRAFEAAAGLEPTRLHALRIAFKRLRYAVEFFAPLFPAKKVARYVDRLTRAQNALGFLQDVDVARGRLTEWTREDADLRAAAAFVLGWHAPRYTRLRRRVLRDCKPLLWGKTPW